MYSVSSVFDAIEKAVRTWSVIILNVFFCCTIRSFVGVGESGYKKVKTRARILMRLIVIKRVSLNEGGGN